MAATRPGSTSGQEALWKLGAGVLDRSAPIAAVLPDLPDLPALREAVATRTSVRFQYRDVERTVDPWGLLLRDGFWYLIGLDHGRGEQRTFRIDRIEGAVETLAGTTFERPAGFDPRRALPADPKMIGATEAVPLARVRIDAARAVACGASTSAMTACVARASGWFGRGRGAVRQPAGVPFVVARVRRARRGARHPTRFAHDVVALARGGVDVTPRRPAASRRTATATAAGDAAVADGAR